MEIPGISISNRIKWMNHILQLRSGITFRGIIRRRFKWDQSALVIFELNKDTVHIYRCSWMGNPIHRYLEISSIEIDQDGTKFKLKTKQHTYLFDLSSDEKASHFSLIWTILKRVHQTKDTFQKNEVPRHPSIKSNTSNTSNKSNKSNKTTTCTICCYNRRHLVRLLPCKHELCLYCYLNWHKGCPFCRSPVYSTQKTVKAFREFLNLMGCNGKGWK